MNSHNIKQWSIERTVHIAGQVLETAQHFTAPTTWIAERVKEANTIVISFSCQMADGVEWCRTLQTVFLKRNTIPKLACQCFHQFATSYTVAT